MKKHRGLQSSDPIKSNPQSFLKILTQSNPIQSNPWMDPIHGQLCLHPHNPRGRNIAVQAFVLVFSLVLALGIYTTKGKQDNKKIIITHRNRTRQTNIHIHRGHIIHIIQY